MLLFYLYCLQKKYEEVNEYLEKVTKTAEESKAEIQERNGRIAECENQVTKRPLKLSIELTSWKKKVNHVIC